MNYFELNLDLNSPECLAQVACPQCDATLVIHIPDQQTPERMLGVCEACRSWFFIDSDAETMWLLPTDRADGGSLTE